MYQRVKASIIGYLLAVLTVMSPVPVKAASLSGSLAGSPVTTDFSGGADHAEAVAVQPDGKIVVAGYTTGSGQTQEFAIARYQKDGVHLDSAFGNNGKTVTPFSGGNAVAKAVAIQPDGNRFNIVVAGFAQVAGHGEDFVVARYTDAGVPDTTFGQNGIVTTDFSGGDDEAQAMALQLDGKIVVAGFSNNGTKNVFAVARYTAAGVPDTGFSSDGKTTSSFANSVNDYAYGVVVQPDDRIMVSGYTAQQAPPPCLTPGGCSQNDFALARYNSDGTEDGSLNNGNGKLIVSLNSNFDETYAVAVQPDGKIVVAGRTENRSTNPNLKDFVVARYTPDGHPDSGFATNGVAETSITSTSNDKAVALALQPDGKIVAAGLTVNPNSRSQSVAVARYNPDGTLDTTFNAGQANGDQAGTRTYDSGSHQNAATALALEPDGRIVVAGFAATTSTGDDFVLLQYLATDGQGWGITSSTAIGFADNYISPTGSGGTTETSDMLTIAGLGTTTCASGVSNCVTVPVSVSSGRYAKNGSTAYSTAFGWASNGDRFNVQQDVAAGAKHGDSTKTTLNVGGLVAANNYAVLLCPTSSSNGCPTQYTFTSIVDVPPTISGTPATSAKVGTAYSFQPQASDQDAGDTLTFGIQNLPVWAKFDTATGALTGTPTKQDVGPNSAIQISVTDPSGATASLPAFTIDVSDIVTSGTSNGGGGGVAPAGLLALLLGRLLRRSRGA